jgi:hypothetical protein
MRFIKTTAVLGVLLCLTATPGFAQLDGLLDKLGLSEGSELDTGQIVAGLKEALEVGTGNAVGVTGQLDGYFANEAIKILMPEQLKSLEKGLRMAGFDSQIDEFILSMNRAAEKAAPAAKDIFWEAIKEMSFADARQILDGGDTAATEYFKANTSERLAEAFHPVVERSMDEVGVTKQYKELLGQAQTIPFLKTQELDIDDYVVSKALDGLFHVLGEEEAKIRSDPAARVTDLLQEVFG